MVGSRPPAVAGTFYPDDPDELASVVDRALATAPTGAARPGAGAADTPKAIIVPHAGYVYSGPVAATAYRAIGPIASQVERVVLLGPAHRIPVAGMAVPDADQFLTPLGVVEIDGEARDRAAALPRVQRDDRPHAPEHSLEVQLPFLQRVLDAQWKVLPVVVGDASSGEVADLLDLFWGGRETLVVVSSDLSHYHDYETAQRLDRRTAAAIATRDVLAIHPEDACGARPVAGLLEAASRHQLDVHLLDLRNSGDTAGPRDRVVGYGAFTLEPSATSSSLADADRQVLLDAAAHAIYGRLAGDEPDEVDPPAGATLAPGASFVTLRRDGKLLGCIGTMEPVRPLIDDVEQNAIAAAFDDPRLPPVTLDDWRNMSIKISVLSPIERLDVDNRDDLQRALTPGVDGLLITSGHHRATFLPTVWSQLAGADAFLDALWEKAGLRAGAWPGGLEAWRYGAEEFGDDGPRAAGR